MFLNLSNHPLAGWPATQRAQAEALGGEILDEPFPDVPPEATTAQVAAMAAALAARVEALRPAAIMIQGEFTLTFCLAAMLESRGLACYAATTRRVVEMVPGADGVLQKRSRFEFVQLRRYAFAAGA